MRRTRRTIGTASATSSTGTTILLAAMAVATLLVAACQGNGDRDAPAATVATASGATSGRPMMDSSGGEVAGALDEAPVAGHWITDANAVSMMRTMTARQLAAADVELSAWHSDTVRAFAADVAREQAAIQRSVDSTAGQLNLSGVAPALAQLVNDSLQATIDSLQRHRGTTLDRAFVAQQVSSLALVQRYASLLAATSRAPELQAVLASAAARVGTQLDRARALNARFAVADSVAAAAASDSVASAARRAAQRKR